MSGQLPGAVHDLTAARIWGIVRELATSGLVVLGDKGYLGEDCIRTQYRGWNKPASQKDANRAHARLRAPGARANAQLKSWRMLCNSAAALGAPDNWPKPSTSFKLARSEDEKGSLIPVRFPQVNGYSSPIQTLPGTARVAWQGDAADTHGSWRDCWGCCPCRAQIDHVGYPHIGRRCAALPIARDAGRAYALFHCTKSAGCTEMRGARPSSRLRVADPDRAANAAHAIGSFYVRAALELSVSLYSANHQD